MKPRSEYAICGLISRRQFWLYSGILGGLFIWALFTSFHGIRYTSSFTSTWWHGDVPWILMTICAWAFSFISMSGQTRELKSVSVNEEGLYEIEGRAISGTWRARGKPQFLRAGMVVVYIVVGILAVLDILNGWLVFSGRHNPTAWSKQNVVMGFCITLLMAANLMQYSRAIRYDYVIRLTQSTRWMTLAVRRSRA